jgi:hypothetical protein
MLKKLLPSVALVATVASLVACAPQQPGTSENPESRESAGSQVEISWSPKADCAICHATESDSLSSSGTAALHASSGCADCHADYEGLAKAHEGVTADDKMPTKLKKTSVEESVCLTCHGTYESLAEKTADVTILTDQNGTTVNPHEVAAAGTGHDSMTCASCHSMHADEPASETSDALCLGCHHADVYECGTCH